MDEDASYVLFFLLFYLDLEKIILSQNFALLLNCFSLLLLFRSEFARLDFHGFYTAVLEKDDVLLSVASIR